MAFPIEVYDRVNTIVSSAPYHYQPAREPFGVDQQPGTHLDRVYYVGMSMLDAEGEIGYSQIERWEVVVGLARRSSGAPHVAHRELVTDIGSLVSTLSRDASTEAWHFETDEFQAELLQPEDTDAMMVAELVGVANLARAV